MNSPEKLPTLRLIKTIWQNKKFIFITNGIILILSIVILLLIPNQYKSSALVSIESDNNMFALPAILKDLPFGIGGGAGADNVLRIMGIGKSRTILDSIISKYDLHTYYETEYRESTYEIVLNNLTILDNEDGTVTISYVDKDPVLASEITNSFFQFIKDLDVKLSITKAKRFREFIVNRSEEAFQKLNQYEDSLKIFSEKTGLVQLETQLKVNFEMLGELEQKKIEFEIQRDFLKENTNSSNLQLKQFETQISIVNEKINSFLNDSKYSNLAINDLPKNALQYLRLFRNVKIQETILEFLIPQVENAKIEEKKNYSSLILIDNPIPAEKKYKPQRSIILFVIMFISFLLTLVYLRSLEIFNENKEFINNLNQK